MDINEVFNMLRKTKTASGFINLAMTNKCFMEVIYNFEENEDKIRPILQGLDLTYHEMPTNRLKLNVFLGICEKYLIKANYLCNYKKSIEEGKLDLAFEYNKRGIFKNNLDDSFTAFEEKLQGNKEKLYLDAYMAMNSFFLSSIHEKDRKYPLMLANILFYEKNSISKNELIKILLNKVISLIKTVFKYKEDDDAEKEIFDELDDYFVSILSYAKLSGYYNDLEAEKIMDFYRENYIEESKIEDFLEEKLIEFLNQEPINFSKEEKEKFKEFFDFDFPSKKEEKLKYMGKFYTNKDQLSKDKCYIEAKFDSGDCYYEIDGGMKMNCEFLKLKTKETKEKFFSLGEFCSPYTFSWSCYLIATENFFLFFDDFDISYFCDLIKDSEKFKNERMEKVISEKGILSLEGAFPDQISQEIPWEIYYEGAKGIFSDEDMNSDTETEIANKTSSTSLNGDSDSDRGVQNKTSPSNFDGEIDNKENIKPLFISSVNLIKAQGEKCPEEMSNNKLNQSYCSDKIDDKSDDLNDHLFEYNDNELSSNDDEDFSLTSDQEIELALKRKISLRRLSVKQAKSYDEINSVLKEKITPLSLSVKQKEIYEKVIEYFQKTKNITKSSNFSSAKSSRTPSVKSLSRVKV